MTFVCQDAAIVGRADGRKRRCEQLLAHLVGCGEAGRLENFTFNNFKTHRPEEQSGTHHQLMVSR